MHRVILDEAIAKVEADEGKKRKFDLSAIVLLTFLHLL
jgi:hypothetical protein